MRLYRFLPSYLLHVASNRLAGTYSQAKFNRLDTFANYLGHAAYFALDCERALVRFVGSIRYIRSNHDANS